MDITDAKHKCALLLYQVEQQTHDSFDMISDHGAEDDYKTAFDSLSAYFLPKRSQCRLRDLPISSSMLVNSQVSLLISIRLVYAT